MPWVARCRLSVPRTFGASTAVNSAALFFAISASRSTPALCTMPSSRPWRCTIHSMQAVTAD